MVTFQNGTLRMPIIISGTQTKLSNIDQYYNIIGAGGAFPV
jgi:hypothetical protein